MPLVFCAFIIAIEGLGKPPNSKALNGIRNYLNNCDVLYVTENKKTATKLVRQIGFFDPKKGLPIGFQQSGFIGSISYKNQNVNIRGKSFSDVFNEQAVKNEAVFSLWYYELQ